MIVRGGVPTVAAVREFIWGNRVIVLVILAVEFAVFVLHRWIPATQLTPVAAGAVGLMATVVGVFIAFRFNEAYSRWWEARILWGGVVNQSRSFARQVTTLLTPDRVPQLADDEEARAVHRELVYRHLAWINALRLALREQPIAAEIEGYLPEAERAELRGMRNVVTQLGQRQARRIAGLLGTEAPQYFLLTQLDETLTRLTDLQGGLERIKKTVFPERVVVASRALVWIVALLVSFAFIETTWGPFLFEIFGILGSCSPSSA